MQRLRGGLVSATRATVPIIAERETCNAYAGALFPRLDCAGAGEHQRAACNAYAGALFPRLDLMRGAIHDDRRATPTRGPCFRDTAVQPVDSVPTSPCNAYAGALFPRRGSPRDSPSVSSTCNAYAGALFPRLGFPCLDGIDARRATPTRGPCFRDGRREWRQYHPRSVQRLRGGLVSATLPLSRRTSREDFVQRLRGGLVSATTCAARAVAS